MWRPRDRERFIGGYDPEHEMPDPDRDRGDRFQSGAYRHNARDTRFVYRANPDWIEGRHQGRDAGRYDPEWNRDARERSYRDVSDYRSGRYMRPDWDSRPDEYGRDYNRDYGRNDFSGRDDYGRSDYGRNDFGRSDYGRNDYGRNDYGRDDRYFGDPGIDRASGYGSDRGYDYDRSGRDRDRYYDDYRGSSRDRDRGWDVRAAWDRDYRNRR